MEVLFGDAVEAAVALGQVPAISPIFARVSRSDIVRFEAIQELRLISACLLFGIS
jgi:hypothetical protein